MRARERNDLILSWLTISAAFALVLGKDFLNVFSFIVAFPICMIAVGAGFVLHEVAHRQVAIKFGAHAEYRAWPSGLLFALLLPIITMGRFLFAAPGAVYIYGPNITLRENGIISVAGAAVNIILAIVFLIIAQLSANQWVVAIGSFGAYINFFLAAFNMLPFGPLDGRKVFMWSKLVWAIVLFAGVAGIFIASPLLP